MLAPSVERWADQVAALTRPGGRLYLHDGHPLAWSLAYETPTLEHTYFEEPDPYVDDSDQTYTDADGPLVHVRSYEWNHSLGEVVTALVERGSAPRHPGRARLDRAPAVPVADRDGARALDHASRSTPPASSFTVVATRMP